MLDKDILNKVEDQILTIEINRPEKKNSMTIEMIIELTDLFKKANNQDDVRCVVITGTGDNFCSGIDLNSAGELFSQAHRDNKDLYSAKLDIDAINLFSPDTHLCMSIMGCYKPVIAAINGPAVGIGAAIILPMDYRLFSDNAKIAYPFTKRGVIPEAGASYFLPRIVSPTKAMDWLISGRLVPAQEALTAGLASSLHKPEELLPAAYALAKEIIANTSSISVALTRQLVWRMLATGHQLDEALAIEIAGLLSMGAGPEAQEGVKSFLERRPPQFPGKVSKDMPPFFPWWEKG
jgi:enoyl-CoA hydratase/carnithine racemase